MGQELLPSQVYQPKDFLEEVKRIQKFKQTCHNGKTKYVDTNGNFFQIDFNEGCIIVNYHIGMICQVRTCLYQRGETMKPEVISDVDLAFPAQVSHLMPKMEDIPEDFQRFNGTKWNRLFNDWFYSGLSKLDLTPKEGIDKVLALRHIQAIMRSFEPKHEHKEASVAYLLSLWFEDGSWISAEKKRV